MNQQDQTDHILQTFALFSTHDAVLEIRALKVGKYKNTAAGYFDSDSKDAFLKAVQTCAQLDPQSIYATLNPVNPDLLARYANRLELRANATTNDDNILRRRFILIDADAVRPAGMSSSDYEHDAALERATACRDMLKNEHGIAAVLADSGNGGHVLIPIDLPNDEESKTLVVRVLATISARFSDDEVKIDRAVFNAARISKIYGTLARKGDNVPDRPHRFSRLLDVPSDLPPASLEVLRELCQEEEEEAPVPPVTAPRVRSTASSKPGSAPFDVRAFIAQHGIEVRSESDRGAWHHWNLDACPFNPEHRDPDSMITQHSGGAITFKCQHQSCFAYGWQELRKHFNPAWTPFDPNRTPGPRGLHSLRSDAPSVPAQPEMTVTYQNNSVEIDQRALDEALSQFAHTETGNAERFIARHGRNLRYCAPVKEWLIWNGQCWKPDRMGKIRNLIFETIREIHHEVATLADKEARDPLSKWALKSEAHRHYAAVEAIATFMDGIPISPDELDTELMLLPVKNGMIDLKTGRLLPHDRKYLNTRCIEIDYDPTATCPHWEAYVKWAMCDDMEMAGYIQRVMGYTLTGLTTERCFFFFGQGGNGKSTITEMMEKLMGGDAQYFAKLPAGSLLENPRGGGSGPSEDITKLRWMRFVSISEMPKNARLNEALIKDFTGARDTITGRGMYEKHSLSYRPHFSIWWYGNDKPIIRGTDRGIWSRFRLIEFKAEILIEDPEIPKQCLAEATGVLSWVVRGCLEWRKNGMQTPRKVTEATDEFRQSEDIIGQFIGDKCDVGPEFAEVPLNLYQAYHNWCTGSHTPVTNTAFGRALDSKGHKSKHGSHNGTRGRFRLALRLKPEDDENATGLGQMQRVNAENDKSTPSSPHVLGTSSKTRQTRCNDTKPVADGLEAYATMIQDAQAKKIPVRPVRVGSGVCENLNVWVNIQAKKFREGDEEDQAETLEELGACFTAWCAMAAESQ